MSTEPLLSIVIPTKNRPATLAIVVAQLLARPEQRLEVVVEDNSDDPAACAAIRDHYADDPRLSWHWEGGSRSAIENCDAAVRRATGTVLCFIGDDDAVTRQAMMAAQWMVEQDVEALICAAGSYIWPDVQNAVRVNDGYNGRLAQPAGTGVCRALNVDRELAAVARAGALTMAELPRLYHGLVRRDVLNRMFDKLGTHFPGPVPDMSNAVGLAAFAGRVWHADVPLTVFGQSAQSMSGRNARRDHQGSITAEASLPANTLANWDPRIPKYWSGPTIWSQAALQAAGQVGHQHFVTQFSFARVYAACLSYNRKEFRHYVADAIDEQPARRRFALRAAIAMEMARIASLRAKVLIPKLFGRGRGTPHADVGSAVAEIEAFIDRHNLMATLEAVSVPK
jgi:hypothetical protein